MTVITNLNVLLHWTDKPTGGSQPVAPVPASLAGYPGNVPTATPWDKQAGQTAPAWPGNGVLAWAEVPARTTSIRRIGLGQDGFPLVCRVAPETEVTRMRRDSP